MYEAIRTAAKTAGHVTCTGTSVFSPLSCSQFGPGVMQQHGFARNVEWSVGSTSADLQPDERDPSIELVLTPSEYSDAMFPYKFKVVYTVTLHGEELQTIYRCASCWKS